MSPGDVRHAERFAGTLSLSLAELARDATIAQIHGQTLLRTLVDKHGMEAVREAAMAAHGFEVWAPSAQPPPDNPSLPAAMRHEGIAAVVGTDPDDTPIVATSTPFDHTTIAKIRRALPSARLVYATAGDIMAIAPPPTRTSVGFQAGIDSLVAPRIASRERAAATDPVEPLAGQVAGGAMTEILDQLFATAVAARASDIHVDPFVDTDSGQSGMQVRFRVDGRLVVQHQLSRTGEDGPDIAAAIARGLQMGGGVDVASVGSIDFQAGRVLSNSARVDARVHVHPCTVLTAEGRRESRKTVIRILDRKLRQLDDLGLSPELLAHWRAVANDRGGLTLVTGPTGSGKTTLVFSTLAEIVSPEIAAHSIEDPIEYHLPNITQEEVTSPDLSTRTARMTKALHDLRRQDADLVFIGEIRDRQSMALAFDLASSGIQVLATAHASSALHAVQRLLEWDVEPFLVASTLRAVLNVRLVRRLCDTCKIPVDHSSGDILWPNTLFGRPLPSSGWRANPAGCPACRLTGAAGRFAVGELLRLNGVSVATIRDPIALARIGDSMVSIANDAVAAVARGHADVESVVTQLGSADAALFGEPEELIDD